jgi:DNA-binding IclR family transcriptional regulator
MRPPRPAAPAHRATARVLEILELVAATGEAFALKELSLRLETPKSSLLPLLRTLTARGYLEQGRTGEYRIGPRALELGAGSPARRELPAVARATLVDLARRTQETVFLAMPTGDGTAVVYVDKIESEQIIRYAVGVGDQRPLHATASGKSLLAFLPAERREAILRSLDLVRFTERTVTSLPALRANLEEIRRTGVCVNVDEIVAGASGIGAPIFDRHGLVVASCAVGGPTSRVRPRARRIAVEVKAAARAISELLGYRPERPGAPAPSAPAHAGSNGIAVLVSGAPGRGGDTARGRGR